MVQIQQKEKGKVGRPTELSSKLTNKVRTLLLQGMDIKHIQRITGINKSNWDTWYHDNYLNFRDFVNDTRRERLLRLAEDVSDTILSLPDTKVMLVKHPTLKDEDGEPVYVEVETKQLETLRLKQSEAEFVRETLGRTEGYAKRTENLGFVVKVNKDLPQEKKDEIEKIFKVNEKPKPKTST